jgi:hypothetical protein
MAYRLLRLQEGAGENLFGVVEPNLQAKAALCQSSGHERGR